MGVVIRNQHLVKAYSKGVFMINFPEYAFIFYIDYICPTSFRNIRIILSCIVSLLFGLKCIFTW